MPALANAIPTFSGGERIADAYDVIRILHVGDLSTAYLAHHRYWDIDLIVKLPSPQLATVPSVLREWVAGLTSEQAETLRVITKYLDELLDLINDTLELSRLEAGKLELERSHVDLPELLRQLDIGTRENPDVQLIWTVSPGLRSLYTDRAKLKTVLKNLIGNAAKFTERGSITIKGHPSREGVEIAVTDTGIGIPKDKQDVIFELFRQGDSSATRRYGGAGLGLYIVRRWLWMMGGEVSVESEVGRGSTFRVWLPISNAPTPAATPESVRAAGLGEPSLVTQPPPRTN